MIVQQLKLESRGNVLERWLAHHLAEVLNEANSLSGPDKTLAEQRAVDLILKLWAHRRALPTPVDPLGGFRDAIGVLGRLKPEDNPWARFSRDRSLHETLLQEIFETMCRTVLGGLLLTQTEVARAISNKELEYLEEEEIFLDKTLRSWMDAFTPPPELPEVKILYVKPREGKEDNELEDGPDARSASTTVSEETGESEITPHQIVAINLERMHKQLGQLLTRWKNEVNKASGSDDDIVQEDDWNADPSPST